MVSNVQYVTDAEGHKISVILPIEEWEEILADLHFAQVAREDKDAPRRPLMEFVNEMRAAGEIDV